MATIKYMSFPLLSLGSSTARLDPKVCGKRITHHRRGYGVDVEALCDRFPLRQSTGKGPKMGSHGYRRLRRWKSGFVAPMGKSIYRRKKYVSGATRGPRGWGRPPLGRTPCLVDPWSSTDVPLPPIYTYVPPNEQIRSQKPNSTAATFCTHEIPPWGLFWSSAGGGIHHGGLLHQHHSLSDDA